jgi:RNA polymerase primary sigma factor
MKLQDIIREAIKTGLRDGFVTLDQLNELLPAATTEPEDIEALMLA